MGNGSVKPKQLKQRDGTVVSLSIGSGCGGGGKLSAKNAAEFLKAKVAELEKEARRRDEDLSEREQRIRGLEEQLAKQAEAIAELSEELQSKSVQLSKLQDVVHTQGGPSLHPSPIKAKFNQHVGGLIRDTLNRRKGAKAGVSAEPTSRTYNSSSLPKFSFEKARVWKDASVKKLIIDALNKNQLLKRLELQQIKDMVECMYQRSFQKGDYVIKQGEPGNHLFVLAAVSQVKTWALDREVFQNIMRMTAETRREQYHNFLRR
ncbi:hypothetical protein AGOR_G00049080 [Albula goreensis]|uniref:Cyclic nucleotide-binding domain-containing protein n=1 Tax=Albula goreensis TaxID=1534307 RepID=A0A8T3DU21_9TELE|nr:hypothetical protein AGOR_G00049080 [Albula goreensis]